MTDFKQNEASMYFNANWQKYKNSINKNLLCHQEMMSSLNEFLTTHYHNRSFTLVDVGCGDSSAISPVLKNSSIKKYIGIDAAPDVLELSKLNAISIPCEKEYICNDMMDAIKTINTPVDLIYTSYAIHHLSEKEKSEFIDVCKSKLNTNGQLLMIDGVLEVNQSRDEWLDKLEARIHFTHPDMTDEELATRMEHPRSGDFPETIDSFRNRATKSGWKAFEVLVDKGIFAFMVFYK
ncbi:class I SAM-dependent methyltransferase [Legionella waltersii]|uniref:tRNA (Cmo5U34)-methyltransferase n=1 Tax=Legionella waltersii TaxID=66969 RepID=A0A0W1AAK0_9GAMM|nr:class I SAM-dependent methyltransferase [Legionella waltersii]KTD78398.1 tRNA (cmo5U34)-methyltransferase [Legionella waltersii]SNV06254.1 3-demethylubiquinone-9 3-O-methyltransferase [Legionella waltersii]